MLFVQIKKKYERCLHFYENDQYFTGFMIANICFFNKQGLFEIERRYKYYLIFFTFIL